MAVPLFSLSEIEHTLAMPKLIVSGKLIATNRHSADLQKEVTQHLVRPEADGEPYVFQLDIVTDVETRETNILLKVQATGRTAKALCRYDIHYGDHESGPPCPPVTSHHLQPHRHIYCPDCVRQDLDWDHCRENVIIPTGGTLSAVIDRLKHKALGDLNIHWASDREGSLFAR